MGKYLLNIELFGNDDPDSIAVPRIIEVLPNPNHVENEKDEYAKECFKLHANYPNPFNASTTISYNVRKPGLIRLTTFDISGREICVIVNEIKPRGNHQVNFNAGDLHSGVYFYRLEAGEYVQTRKMLLVK